MNERIRELWDEAAKLEPDPSWEGQTKFMEKFAELIVRECAMIVEGFEITQEVALDEYVDYEASTVLKEHFGVEE
jgi:hypothetical protein